MMKRNRSIWVSGMIMAFLAGAVLLPGQMIAGDLEPPAAPGPTMKTLDEIPPTWSQKLSANVGVPCDSERFECVLDGGAVLDKETGLVWERGPDDDPKEWTYAEAHCYNNVAGGRKGWRLPTVEELASLVDPTQTNPALPLGHPFLNVELGQDPLSLYYWSSSSSTNPTSAWYVYFGEGHDVDDGGKYNLLYVWCVRGGHGHDAN